MGLEESKMLEVEESKFERTCSRCLKGGKKWVRKVRLRMSTFTACDIVYNNQ